MEKIKEENFLNENNYLKSLGNVKLAINDNKEIKENKNDTNLLEESILRKNKTSLEIPVNKNLLTKNKNSFYQDKINLLKKIKTEIKENSSIHEIETLKITLENLENKMKIDKKNELDNDIKEKEKIKEKFNLMRLNDLTNISDMKFFTTSVLYPNIDNPMEILENCNYAYILKDFETNNMINSYELKIRYRIYIKDNLGNLIFLFKAKENSGMLARNFLR